MNAQPQSLLLPDPLPLDGGAELARVEVAYETYGTLADVRGLQGEENIARLALEARSGDAGGPILDRDGRVLGMLLPRANGARELPEDVAFAVESKVIAELAQKAGVTVDTTASSTTIKPQDLREKAKGMTVLVSCWE